MLRRRAKPLLGTLVEISVGGFPETSQADAAISSAFAEIALIHDLMSFHRVESDVGRMNASATGDAVTVDMRTAAVLLAASQAAVESEYAFDCTVAVELVASGLLPSHPSLAFASAASVRPAWEIDGNCFVKLAPCLIDLSGIAKGYAVDRAIAILRQHGCGDALVNAGGDMRHSGSEAAIVHLRAGADPGSLPLAVKLCDQALASSTAGGLDAAGAGALSALIDGVSRLPIATGASVSVLAPTCMEADLLTKVVLASENPRHPMLARHGAETVQYCR